MSSITHALFDLDGVVIIGRSRYFSEVFAEKQGIAPEVVQEFFLNDFKKCTFGKADLKEEVAPYLPKWGWEGSIDAFLELWFASESTKDIEVLALVKRLRDTGVACYIATRQEKHRMQYLWETVGLQEHFDGYFVTCELGLDKSDPAFFERVFSSLQAQPQDVLYFDDLQKNIDVARELGVDAHFYTGRDLLEEKVNAFAKMSA